MRGAQGSLAQPRCHCGETADGERPSRLASSAPSPVSLTLLMPPAATVPSACPVGLDDRGPLLQARPAPGH
ncbi:hypothetical protein NDU88_004907 [Pleurodeles waltl]|uniref:Uncharacterized protein n=1 Tax=Pleurodeles waltl TaxID=8319 RepID=A0AAV7T8V2_PLEWA|nr:hypothetical protein NDU88_004907 [Pleurodeles waltl]